MIRRIKVATLMAQLRGRGDSWWGFKGEPCCKEVQDAIVNKDFEETVNDEPGTKLKDMYSGNRKRHVARLAYLIANPKTLTRLSETIPFALQWTANCKTVSIEYLHIISWVQTKSKRVQSQSRTFHHPPIGK
jgi:hypothetical protein